MKYLFIILFCLIGYVAWTQTRPAGNPTQFSTGWFKQGYVEGDSGIIFRPRDTASFLPRFTGTTVFDPTTRRPYFYDSTELRWHRFLFEGDVSGAVWGTITGTLSNQTDLQNALNLKLNISDTTAMLLPYLRKADTASLSNRINLKLNISDTSTMLLPYLRKADTTAMLNPYIRGSGTAGQVTYWNGTRSLTGQSSFLYNDATNRFSADTGTYSRLQAGVTTNFTADSILIFSDSYGTGVGASDIAHGFARLLSAGQQLILVNYSISGSTLMKRTPIDPYGGSPQNLVDQTAALGAGTNIDKVARRKYVLIAKGLNDVGYNGANYTPANYSADYQTILNLFISKGWAASEIIMVTPWWITTAGYASYASTTGTTQVTAARHIEFVDTVIAIANRYGCKIFDIYRDEGANGSNQFLVADNIHPSNPGHSFIATQINAYLGYTVLRNNQSIAANTISEFGKIRLSSVDTMQSGYLFQILGRDSSGMIRTFPTNGIIRNNTTTIPDASTINLNGKIIINQQGTTFWPTTDVELMMVNGVIKGNGLRAAGSLPSGMTGNSVELGMIGSVGYIGAYNRTATSALTLSINGLGGTVITGATAASGAQAFQVLNGGVYSSGSVSIGINAAARRLHAVIDDAVTNAITYVNRFTHTSSGTVTTGFGPGSEYEAENASGTNRIAGAFEWPYTDATNATEDADFVVKTIRAGTLTEGFRLTSTGNITTGVWQATTIGPTFGGTGLTSYTTGDLPYASAANVLSKLAIGATGFVLTSSGTIPQWSAPNQLAIVTESSAGTLTLAGSTDYIHTSTGSTWTLPALSSSLGVVYRLKNAGSGNITLNRAGSDNLYNTASVTSLTILPGESYILIGGTSFWYIE